MGPPVVISNTASAPEADLLASHLRSQGIEATARTNLDRSAYAGLGGATVLVPAEQRMEAELELMLLEEARPEAEYEAVQTGARPARKWLRVVSYMSLTAMVLGSALPSLAIMWSLIHN